MSILKKMFVIKSMTGEFSMIGRKYYEKDMARNSIYKRYSRYITLGNCSTFVVEKGKGETIILIHGLASSVYTWRGIINKLAMKYHVVALDLMGSGFSEKPVKGINVETFTEQLLELMNRLHINSAVLVGNSLGGKVALNFTIKHPERVKGIVLIDSTGYQKPRERRGMLFKLCRYKAFESILKMLISRRRVKRYLKSAFYNKSAINRRVINSYYRPLKTAGGIKSLRSLAESLSYEEFNFEILKTLNLPTLIIWGEKDDWIPSSDGKQLNKHIKGSKLVLIGNCGHAPQEEYPVEVEGLIEKFLDENKKN